MVSREVRQYIEKKNKYPSFFLALLLSLYSIINGTFYIVFEGYLLSRSEPYLHFLPEKLIGISLILFGLLLIIGAIAKKRYARIVGIIGLTAIWGGLTLSLVVFAFGTGYPDVGWLDKLVIVILLLRLSFKGEYVK